jgi:hypothetical protein
MVGRQNLPCRFSLASGNISAGQRFDEVKRRHSNPPPSLRPEQPFNPASAGFLCAGSVNRRTTLPRARLKVSPLNEASIGQSIIAMCP